MPHDDHLRPYDRRDRDDLWKLKAAFENELGACSGTEKASRYKGKLTPEYRERYLAWIKRCVERDPRCVTVAEGGGDRDTATDTLTGYAFLLPEELSFVWDAAVLNEIYVQPADRGTGLADNLMEAALGVARDQNLPLDRLVLDVDRDNERARAFYDQWGFDHWGEMVARDL